eukprot:53770_1
MGVVQAVEKVMLSRNERTKYVNKLMNEENEARRKYKEDQAKRQYQLRKLNIDNIEKQNESKRSQRQSAIDSIKLEMKQVKQQIDTDQKELLLTHKKLSEAQEKLNKTNLALKTWPTTRREALNHFDSALKAAKKDYNRDCQAIENTIQATGVHETNVAKFLRIAHNVINAGAATRISTNKLSTQISTFGEIIKQQCSTKLSIQNYFTDIEPELQRFVPILEAKNMYYLDDIKCHDQEEFDSDILTLLQDSITAEQKNDSSVEISGSELAEQLLQSWGLGQYIKMLKNEGWEDPVDWAELTEEDLLELNFKKGHMKKFKREYQKWLKQSVNNGTLSFIEKRKLKSICLQSAKTWEKDAKMKSKHVKQTLMTIAPVLGKFFAQINDAVKQAQIILEYPQQLNDECLLNEQQIKSMNMIENDEKKNSDRQRELWDTQSKCEIYSESDEKWLDGTIVKIINDKEGEWLTIAYRTGQENITPTLKQIQRFAKEIRPAVSVDAVSKINGECVLTKASVTKFNIVESLKDECKEDTVKLMALTLAMGVEDGCVAIFKSQGIIRQSVILAQDILKLKPANMNDSTTKRKLWKSVDDGIINIFNSAVEMVKVSAKYFSFFLRFKSSFGYFMSCYENDNEQKESDISLTVSMEYLLKDIREFDAFQQSFHQKVNELERKSMKVISECVRTAIGAEEFEISKTSRAKTLQIYLDKQKEYDQKLIDLGQKLNKIWDTKIEQISTSSQLKYQCKLVEKSISNNQKYYDKLASRLNSWQKYII